MNLQVQLANTVAERDEAKTELQETRQRVQILENQQGELATELTRATDALQDARVAAGNASRVRMASEKEVAERAAAEMNKANTEIESLKRRVAEVELDASIKIRDGQSAQSGLEKRFWDESARAKRLSETLQTSERVGANLRQEVSKLQAEATETRKRVLMLERSLESARNSMNEAKEGNMSSLETKDRLIQDLRNELLELRTSIDRKASECQEEADCAADVRIQKALEEARYETERILEVQREKLLNEGKSEKEVLQHAVEEAQAEAERWKGRLQESDELRTKEGLNLAKESKRVEALKAELLQVNEDLAKSKRNITGDDLRNRLESLKEVVSHTLREKAELEEELIRIRERVSSQDNAADVIQDLQDRLQTVKEMNARLDNDNEDLRMRLHTAHATLRQHHITLSQQPDPNLAEMHKQIRTPGGRKLSASSSRASAGRSVSSVRSSSSRKL